MQGLGGKMKSQYIDKCQYKPDNETICNKLKETKYEFCRPCMDKILKLDEQYKQFLKEK